eukprot:7798519-Heterocapsa_arctica.AAC.1
MTLDIVEPQVIVEYPEDENGFFWHHRVLMKRVNGPRWIAMMPDEALVNLDLDAIRHIVVDRAAEFPRTQRPY